MTSPPPPQSQKKIDAGKIKGAIVITDCIEVVWYFGTPLGKQAHLVTHANNSQSHVPVNVSLATALFAQIASAYAAVTTFMATDWPLGSLSVRDMSSKDNPVIFQSGGTGFTGTSTSPALPPQTAIVMTGDTGIRGRSAKARLYTPGWATNADGGGGVIHDDLIALLPAFGVAIRNGYNTESVPLTLARPARAEYLGITGTPHPARDASMANVTVLTSKDNRFDTVRNRAKI